MKHHLHHLDRYGSGVFYMRVMVYPDPLEKGVRKKFHLNTKNPQEAQGRRDMILDVLQECNLIEERSKRPWIKTIHKDPKQSYFRFWNRLGNHENEEYDN